MNDRTFGVDIGADRATVTVQNGAHWAALDVELDPLPADLLGRVGEYQPCVLLSETGGFWLRHAHRLYVEAVERALAIASARLNAPAVAPVSLAVPSWWTRRAVDWTLAALGERGLNHVRLIDAAQAAVVGARAWGVGVPEDVLVLDLGARSCSAVVVSGGGPRTQLASVPGTSTVHLHGGASLDRRLLHQILASLGELGYDLDRDNPEHVAAATAYLHRCREIRHDLSVHSAATVEPYLPGATHRLRLVREEFEELVQPWRNDVVRIAQAALAQCPRPVGAVLLVGGLSATPLVGQSISAGLDLEVLTVEDPAAVVAYGAARVAMLELEPESSWARRKARMARRWPRLAPPEISAAVPQRLALPAGPPAVAAPVEQVRVAEPIEARSPVPIPLQRRSGDVASTRGA